MGWLLSRKPSRGKSRKKKQSLREPWTLRRVWQLLQPLTLVLFLGALAAGWYFGQGYLSDYAANRAKRIVTIEQVALVDAQPWMSPMLRDELRQVVAARLSDNPLDGQTLNAAASALEASPWVADVSRVERTDQGVLVSATYREPVALVETNGAYVLVDANAVRLPGEYQRKHIDAVGLPVIVGVSAPAPLAGDTWTGDQVQAGLSLSAMLRDEPFSKQIAAYDVGRRDERGRLRMMLHTTRGGVVVWGLPPGGEMAVEASAESKVHRLSDVYLRHKWIDANGKVVEVFGGAVFVHQSTQGADTQRVGYSFRR